jgi:ferredoxin-NADP reductase
VSTASAGTLHLRVESVEPVTPEISRFTFVPTDGSWLPPFSGGSHVTVLIETKEGTHRNAYSLMSSPYDASKYQIAVRRVEDGKGGSVAIHRNVKAGDIVPVTIPANLFPLSKHARHHVFIAGGVGITPVFAQLEELSLKGDTYELHLAVRGAEHSRLGHELRERYGDSVTLYEGGTGNRMNIASVLAERPLGTHVYVCGPSGMIDEVVDSAHALGWTDSHIHFERFEDAGSTGEPFSATMAKTGVVINVSPDQSLLEAAEEQGYRLPYLCRGGACGECELEVVEIEGTIDHRDDWLSEKERAANSHIMPCVSRGLCSKLVINA